MNRSPLNGRIPSGADTLDDRSAAHHFRRMPISVRNWARLAPCILVLALGWAAPASLVAQHDPGTLHATLADWEDRTWLLVLDRSASVDGRLSSRGILQRFRRSIDDEYRLDQVGVRPGLTEEYEWWSRDRGARYWAGSVSNYRTVAAADFKTRVELGAGWSSDIAFTHESFEERRRSLVRLRFEKRAESGLFGYALGTLLPVKPEMDLEFGGGWRTEKLRASGALVLMDYANDLVLRRLGVPSSLADTALVYDRVPLALRGRLEWRPVPEVRIEAHGSTLLRSDYRAFRQEEPENGFEQSEEFTMAGGLIEVATSDRTRVGAFGTWVRARSDRSPLGSGNPAVDYRLVERTGMVGGFVLAELNETWRVEGWLAREERPETRVDRSPEARDVDYEDRAWIGSAALRGAGFGGWLATLALDMDHRTVLRGAGDVPWDRSFDADNSRLRLEGGWRHAAGFRFVMGLKLDLDRDLAYDGVQGRVVYHWR